MKTLAVSQTTDINHLVLTRYNWIKIHCSCKYVVCIKQHIRVLIVGFWCCRLGWLLTLGLYCALANEKHCKRKRVNSVFMAFWLPVHILVHVAVQMFIVQIIKQEFHKLLQSQLLIGLFYKGVYNCAFTRRRVYFLLSLYCIFHNWFN